MLFSMVIGEVKLHASKPSSTLFHRRAPRTTLPVPPPSLTGSLILDALDRLMVGRTTFVIAHRLSTVRRADVILVMDSGRLVESGTHAELMERHGLYRQLHEIQTTVSRLPRLAAREDTQGQEADAAREAAAPASA